MNLAPRDRRALLLGGGALTAMCAFNFVLMPLLESWSTARQRAADAGGELDRIESRLRRVVGQRKRLARIYGPAVNAPLQDPETAQANLFKAAQDVLKKGGIKDPVYEFQPCRPVRDVPGVEHVPLQIRGKCDPKQLAQCLAGMRKAPSLVIVDRFTIANDLKKPGQLTVTLVLGTLATAERSGS